MNKITVSLVGAGQRGKDVYGNYALKYPENIKYIAVVEPDIIKRNEFAKLHNISPNMRFNNWDEFFEKGKLSDAIVIATPDDMHFIPTKKALQLGYDILLEKPMSNNKKECISLGQLAEKHDNIFMICHVLRYTPFYSTLKKLIHEKIIGDIISIQHNENIGYFHFGHSFVRGNWRNSDLSSPLILQKSCHDMDILLWLVNSKCTKISSFGKLTHFTHENQPEGASNRCLDCKYIDTCIYSAPNLYYNHIGKWPTTAITPIQNFKNIKQALKTGPYGKCVYHTDNNVVDHQSTIIEFENGVVVDFNLSAFTDKTYRNIKIMGTKGEIHGNDMLNKIKIKLFGSNETKIIAPETISSGHGGGDTKIMEDFISLIKGQKEDALTSARVSVESHMMAFAAEESRKKNRVILMKDFYKS